jgi:ribosomal-protein-alanine N-acetyltransferase
MELSAGASTIRPYSSRDSVRLAQIADDRRISVNMTDRFPYPYTEADAGEWIDRCKEAGDPPGHLAIEHDGLLVGGIGIDPLHDEQRHVGLIGYWLTPSHWGQGIATSALSAMIPHVFDAFDLRRLQASVVDWNPASGRVLEKCGFSLEGRQRNAIVKDDKHGDLLLYGLVRESLPVRGTQGRHP